MTTTLAGAGGSIFVFMGPHPFSAPNDILRRARSYSYCSSAHRQQQQHAGTRWLGRAGRGAAGRVALQVNAAYCLHTFLFDMLLGTAACGILSVGAQQSVPLLGSKSFFSCRYTESSTVEASCSEPQTRCPLPCLCVMMLAKLVSANHLLPCPRY